MPLFSQQQGDPRNPILVFLHGFLGRADDWQETIKHLKNDYYCICLDLPGHGHSAALAAPLKGGFQYCHRLIKETLDNLSINQYSFIAYSLGGRIALDYRRTQNDNRLQHLILESCHTGLTQKNAKQQRYQLDLEWSKRFATQTMTENLWQWYQQPLFEDLTLMQKKRIIKQRRHNDGVSVANMLLATSLAQQTDARPFLLNNSNKQKPFPITYCFGEKDLKFKRLAHHLSTQINIKVMEFNGVGHNIHQQAPQQYAQFVRQQIALK